MRKGRGEGSAGEPLDEAVGVGQVEEDPGEEAGGSAEEHVEGAETGAYTIEAEGDGKEVTHEGEPGEEGEPGAEATDAMALGLEALPADAEPPLYPVPATQPADGVGGEAAQPVAEGGHGEAYPDVGPEGEDAHEEEVGAHRHDRGGEEGAEEEAQVSPIDE